MLSETEASLPICCHCINSEYSLSWCTGNNKSQREIYSSRSSTPIVEAAQGRELQSLRYNIPAEELL